MKQFRLYFIISLLIHLVLLLLLRLPQSTSMDVVEPSAPIWIDLKKDKYEIADIEPPAIEKKSRDSHFLGMYDSTVSQEEVAAVQGRDEKQRIQNRQSKTKNLNQELFDFDKGIFAAKMKMKETPSEALPEDFYPDLKKGEHTYLNVMRFPDIQYFVRLKRVFKITFDPLVGLKEAYLNNQITRGKVETILGISVDAKGNLAEAFIFKGSGIERYDQEALRTIRASSPFSSPPSKLLDKEGLLRMSWTFTVYL